LTESWASLYSNSAALRVRKEGSAVIVTMDRVFQSDQNTSAWNEAGIDV